jgi:hypothetical protein
MLVGQLSATPPVTAGVLSAEIFEPLQNSFAERGELQLAMLVSTEAAPVIMHL